MVTQCFICTDDSRVGTFCFPIYPMRLEEWMKLLNLAKRAPKLARLCIGHFKEDITVTKRRRLLRTLAKPTLHLQLTPPKPFHDHTYAKKFGYSGGKDTMGVASDCLSIFLGFTADTTTTVGNKGKYSL